MILSRAQLGDLLALISEDSAALNRIVACFLERFPPPHLFYAAQEALAVLLELPSPQLPVCSDTLFSMFFGRLFILVLTVFDANDSLLCAVGCMASKCSRNTAQQSSGRTRFESAGSIPLPSRHSGWHRQDMASLLKWRSYCKDEGGVYLPSWLA